jgi:hypothetical protein
MVTMVDFHRFSIPAPKNQGTVLFEGSRSRHSAWCYWNRLQPWLCHQTSAGDISARSGWSFVVSVAGHVVNLWVTFVDHPSIVQP